MSWWLNYGKGYEKIRTVAACVSVVLQTAIIVVTLRGHR